MSQLSGKPVVIRMGGVCPRNTFIAPDGAETTDRNKAVFPTLEDAVAFVKQSDFHLVAFFHAYDLQNDYHETYHSLMGTKNEESTGWVCYYSE